MTEGRNKLFFKLAVAHALCGASKYEIEAKLSEYAGRQAKLLKKIPSALRSLENYGLL